MKISLLFILIFLCSSFKEYKKDYPMRKSDLKGEIKSLTEVVTRNDTIVEKSIEYYSSDGLMELREIYAFDAVLDEKKLWRTEQSRDINNRILNRTEISKKWKGDSLLYESEYVYEYTYFRNKLIKLVSDYSSSDHSDFVDIAAISYNWLGKVNLIVLYTNKIERDSGNIRYRRSDYKLYRHNLFGKVSKVIYGTNYGKCVMYRYRHNVFGYYKRLYSWGTDDKPVLDKKYMHNIKGELLGYNWFQSIGVVGGKHRFEYDRDGRITKNTFYRVTDSLFEMREYFYHDFDNKGNYTKKVEKSNSGEVLVTKRTIEYYND